MAGNTKNKLSTKQCSCKKVTPRNQYLKIKEKQLEVAYPETVSSIRVVKHYNPQMVMKQYATDMSFRRKINGGIFRKNDEDSLAFHPVIPPRNAAKGLEVHGYRKQKNPTIGRRHVYGRTSGSFNSTPNKPSKRISFIVDLDNPNFIEINGPLPYSFAEALNQLMKIRGATNESLAEASNLSSKTISRLRNRGTDPSKEVVVALCIGLSLDPYTGFELLSRAGKTLPGTIVGRAYALLIGLAAGITIFEANEMLSDMGIPILGSPKP